MKYVNVVFAEKLPNEVIISSNDEIILSSHRIRQYTESSSLTTFKSFMLENITSCKVEKSITWRFLLFAIFLGIIAFITFTNSESMRSDESDSKLRDILGIFSVVTFVLALLSAVRFFLSFKRQLTIATNSDKMISSIGGLTFENVVHFVELIEQTREKRLISLK